MVHDDVIGYASVRGSALRSFPSSTCLRSLSIIDRQMTPIRRWRSKTHPSPPQFHKNLALPFRSTCSDFATARHATLESKECLSVRCPIQWTAYIQILHRDDLGCLATKGENLDRAFRSRTGGEAFAIGRNGEADGSRIFIRIRIAIIAKEFAAPFPCACVKGRDDKLFAVLGRLSNRTQIGRESGTGKSHSR